MTGESASHLGSQAGRTPGRERKRRAMRKSPSKGSLQVATLTCCAIFWLGAGQAGAVCPPQESGGTPGQDPFQYVLALTESFSHARSALASVTPAQSSGGNLGTDQQLSGLADRLQSAAEDYACAAELVVQYAESSEESTALSAQAVAFTYIQLSQLDQQKMELIQAALAGSVAREDLEERLNRGRAQTEEAWRLLIPATVMGTVALTVPPARQEDPVTELRISSQQRRTLAERLEQDFGAELREEATQNESPLVSAARLLHGFVLNPDLSSSDAR